MIPYLLFEKIDLGPISIQVWGLFVVLAFCFALFIAYHEAKRLKISSRHIFNLGAYSLLGALVGARLFYVAVHWNFYYRNFLDIFKIWQGGLILYGGAIFAFLIDLMYIRKHKLNFWQIADLAAPAVAFGLFVGRIGCFAIHDHLGKVMDRPWPWGINYFGEIRHETALYSALNGLLMFLGMWMIRKRIKKEGVLFLIFLVWYSVARFIIDAFRDFDIRVWGLTGSQYISIILFLVAAYLLLFRFKRKPKIHTSDKL